MPGRLATLALAGTPSAPTSGTLYTVPAGQVATVNVIVNNTGLYAGLVSIAVMAGGVPVAGEYIEQDTLMSPGDRLECTALVLTAGQSLWVSGGFAGNVNVMGFTE
jgi:predicted transcriptional regulator